MIPRVQAILIADHVYEDRATGKKVVAGIFDKLAFIVPEQLQERIAEQLKEKGIEDAGQIVPGGMESGSPTAYIRLTDVRGEQAFVARYVYVNEEQVLFTTSFRINSTDPLQAVDVVLPLPRLPSDKAGTFALELVWNDDVIGSHRIIVKEISLPERDE
jgi:hypothetical protein